MSTFKSIKQEPVLVLFHVSHDQLCLKVEDVNTAQDWGHVLQLNACCAQAPADACRSSERKCIFTGDGPFQWCVTMQDGGGFHINSLLQYGGFSQ